MVRDVASSRLRAIPDVLTGGNHGAIARWRRERSDAITRERRPDLIAGDGKG